MNEYLNLVAKQFTNVAPSADVWSLRLTNETHEAISVRQGVLQGLSGFCNTETPYLTVSYGNDALHGGRATT